jgi:hypothetical protein
MTELKPHLIIGIIIVGPRCYRPLSKVSCRVVTTLAPSAPRLETD